MLAEMLEDGARAAAMEVSSHALSLERVDGCRFDVAVFTNLTRDHLDFHGDMESYYVAKRRLFALRKPGAFGVVNADDPYGRRLIAEIPPPLASFSATGAGADFRAGNARCDLRGVAFDLAYAGGSVRIESPLLGRFQVANLCGAAAAGIVLGVPPEDVAAAIATVSNVPGRLEPVRAGQAFPILVDYAHTPDALERLLSAVRELTGKRLVLVFGCGGDRDRGKRAPMGEIAGRLADLAIATSDNPRSEDPEKILREVEVGLARTGAGWRSIADRLEAIRAALAEADANTVVVIAGKGHETTQVVAGVEHPFDDRRIAAELAGRP
jgi:UDP-N-acetylmuramoyl-L-alanyl-D-glutamate--2,6-diaminopimelate ligase